MDFPFPSIYLPSIYLRMSQASLQAITANLLGITRHCLQSRSLKTIHQSRLAVEFQDVAAMLDGSPASRARPRKIPADIVTSMAQ